MSRIISSTKSLIKSTKTQPIASISRFEYAAMLYPFTNENINGYLKAVNINGKSNALSVLASGDHPFSLINNGIYDVDTFDINALTEYYALGLKRAMILNFSYEEFKMAARTLFFQFSTIDDVANIILSCTPYMDKKYQKFWEKIIDYYYAIEKRWPGKNNFKSIFFDYDSTNWKGVSYLSSKGNYNLFKSQLNKANISFKRISAFELPQKSVRNYDIVLMSNILDYADAFWGRNWTISELNNYKNQMMNLLNPYGLLFLHNDFHNTDFANFYPFADSEVTYKEINCDEIVEVKNRNRTLDRIILYRRKDN